MMRHAICYTRTERFWLAALGVFGFFVVNGAFAYGLLFQPDAMTAAWTNPLAAAFMAEAMVLVGVFAYLFERWRVSRLGWGWFVFLSLLGSMAVAIPVVLLFPRRDQVDVREDSYNDVGRRYSRWSETGGRV